MRIVPTELIFVFFVYFPTCVKFISVCVQRAYLKNGLRADALTYSFQAQFQKP